jgi:hypothetical protein
MTMNQWSEHHLAYLIAGRWHRRDEPMRRNAALASTIRYWLKLRRPMLLAPPPVARVLQADRELAERIASGLERGPVRPEAMHAIERMLRDARPRKDDLRRAVYLVEAR